MTEPVKLMPYREWREAFNTEKVYTRQDMANALHEQRRAFELASQIKGISRMLPNGDEHMLVIQHVRRDIDGIFIICR